MPILHKKIQKSKEYEDPHQEYAHRMLCSYCGRSYEFLTSYKAHYNQNLCIKVIVPGMIEDVEDSQADPEDEQDSDDESEEEEGGQCLDFAA